VSDQAAISFVPLDPPTDGIVALFAEEGPKLTPIAKTIDKSSKGLLSRAAEISGFKGKKDSAIDLIAPSGLKFPRLVLIGMDKPSSYREEDWLNLGGSVRAQFTGREGDTVHIILDAGPRVASPEDVANFALGAQLRGYKFQKYKSKAKKKNGAAENDRSLKRIVIHCADPKAAIKAFVSARALANGVTIAREIAIPAATPMPCSMRPTTSHAMAGETAATTLPSR